METLHQQLKEALLEYRTLQKVQKHHAALVARFEKDTAELNALKKRLKKAEKDVESLERTSVRQLFHRILGDTEKQLEKERQEYLQTALNYNELVKTVELTEFEMGVLVKKLDRLDEVTAHYNSLLARREKELMAQGGETGNILMDISRQIDQKHILIKDIDEAIAAGERAYGFIKTIHKKLKEARDWGSWDIYSDGGGWMKHHAIDQARELLHKARHALLNFDDELRDVYPNTYVSLNIGVESIDKFMDVFLDNIITDWVVQQKIKRALKNVSGVKSQVEDALHRLKKDLPLAEYELSALEREREATIIDSAP